MNNSPDSCLDSNLLSSTPETNDRELDLPELEGPLTSLIERDITQLNDRELEDHFNKLSRYYAGGAHLASAMEEEVEVEKLKATKKRSSPRKSRVLL